MSIHINANKCDVAKKVLMAGDPLRVKYIAEKYLTDYKLVNTIRNNYIYTGFYNGKKISIASSGMGFGSMGIYAYELFDSYDVSTIIRVGSCGSYQKNIKLLDIILADKAYTTSNFSKEFNNKKCNICNADGNLNNNILENAKNNNINIKLGTIDSTSCFYKKRKLSKKELSCLGVEMESFALFYIAKILKKNVACILTVSDNIFTAEQLDAKTREEGFDKAIVIALNSLR